MSTISAGSSIDLVHRMQPRGDLQLIWIMFDYVKRVVGWTSLGAHVYDPIYCKVMRICICDMMYEMADAHKQMWLLMLALLKWHGLRMSTLKDLWPIVHRQILMPLEKYLVLATRAS